MSINVVVSSTAAGVSVSGGTSVAITVSGSTAAAVTVGGGIGPAGFLINPGTATNAFGTFQLTAGDGITISTSAAQFQISSYGTTAVSSFAPVQSVAGRVGSVVLQASDVTAGTFAIGRIPTISYTALSNVPATLSPSAHTHSTSDVVSFTAAAAAAAPVQSVAGRSGAVSLAVADISGLAAVASSGSYTSLQNVPATLSPSAHTHSTSDVVSFTAAAAAAAPVQSVQSRTGAVTLTRADLTAAAEVHTHSTTDVVGLTAAFSQVGHTHDAAAVTSGTLDIARIPVIGYTAISGTPGSFSPGAHTHSTTDVVAFTAAAAAAAPVQSVAGRTGAVTLAQLGSSGTASSTTFLRGDGVWSAAGSTDASALASGTVAAARLPLATTSAAGAVIVGSGLTITSGVLSRSSSYDPAAAPGAPSGIAVNYQSGLVSWNASPGGVATQYEVQRSVGGTGTWTTLATVSSLSLNLGTYLGGWSNTDKFRIRGLNADSLPGEWGYQEGATPGSGGSANIVEAATAAGFPATGASQTIYISRDQSRVFRYDSSGVYIELGN